MKHGAIRVRERLQKYIKSKEWKAIQKTIDYEELLKPYNARYKKEENRIKDIERNKERIENEILYEMVLKNEIKLEPVRKTKFSTDKKKTFKDLSLKEKYEKYMSTKQWIELSRKVRENKKCFMCDSDEDLNVHHLNYDNIKYEEVGNEFNSDVIVVCATCHRKIHNLHNIFQIITKNQDDADKFFEILENSIIGYGTNYSGYYVVPQSKIRLKDIYLKENEGITNIVK